MASILSDAVGLAVKVRRRSDGKPGVVVKLGEDVNLYFSREEAAQLATDLLDAIDSQKVAP